MKYNTPELLLVGAAQNLVLDDSESRVEFECFTDDGSGGLRSYQLEMW